MLMKTTTVRSVFQPICHCTTCSWVRNPYDIPHRWVCPRCGGDTTLSIGQYLSKEKSVMGLTISRTHIGAEWRATQKETPDLADRG